MFWQLAVKSGLLDAQKLETCWKAIPLDKRGEADAIDRRLARQAVGAGFLTVWQAQQLLAGRYQNLRIDRYELQDLLGQGGMGRVYLARDTRLRRPVALKILSRDRMTNPRALARFRREARVGAQLQHENLIRVYDEGESQGVRFLVMEYIHGLTVGKMITQQGRLPFNLAANLGREVALGLEHLHEKGLLHRDVNPMNILVDRDGTAKLTDLGLAIDPDDDEEGVVTREGATVGTFDYISPEQARHSRQVDTRSDIYSLGCTLFHMIAGRVPFPAPSLPEKLFAHQQTDPEPLTKLAPGVPEGLDAVVRKMMRKRPDDRFARPRDVARALEPYATLTAGPAPAEHQTPPLPLAARAEGATVVENGTAPKPSAPVAVLTASDPELAVPAAGAEAATPTEPGPSEIPSSGPSDPFRIDLGPPPPLSASLTSSRSTDDGERRPGLWIALGLIVLFVLIVAGMAYQAGWLLPQPRRPHNGPGENKAIARPEDPPPVDAEAPAGTGVPEVVIQYDDGEKHVSRSLRDAILLSAGRPATVILANKEPLKLDIDKPITLVRDLRIRAAPGTTPEVAVKFLQPVSLFDAPFRSRVHLEGLKFRLDVAKAGQDGAFIKVGGQVDLTRCSIAASPDAHALKLLQTGGGSTRLDRCWIEGFDVPIQAVLFPDFHLTLSQCMFVRPVANGPAQGWVVSAHNALNTDPKPRTITFDHCTVAGLGLLWATGFETGGPPLQVKARQTVVAAPALMMWAGAFPGVLDFEGQGDLYRITGNAWVVQPPAGTEPIAQSPANFETWSKTWSAGPIREQGSRAQDFHFQNEAPANGHFPTDYILLDVDPPKPGADPEKVGAGTQAP